MQVRTVELDPSEVKKLCLSRGWNREMFAEKVGCSVKTITNIQKGKPVLLSTLAQVAIAFNVDHVSLLKKQRHEPPGPPDGDPQEDVPSNVLLGALTGSWKVVSDQPEGPAGGRFKHTFVLKLSANETGITGEYVLVNPSSEVPYVIAVTGTLRSDRFLRLEYRCKDLGVLLFGQMLVRMADDPRIMEGTFSGNGPATRKLIHGIVRMSKMAEGNTATDGKFCG
jgi:transcriptional regulator with XRE-family HTH domain